MSEDALLGGRGRLRQPANGARTAIDPVFLAAAIAAEPNQFVLDVGCGIGAAALCVAVRVPQCRIIGLELQRELVRIAGDNVVLNGMSGRVSVMAGDLLAPPPRLSPGMFDHVMANPPFIERGRGTPAANPAKAAATIEGDANLGDWVRFALAMARGRGTVKARSKRSSSARESRSRCRWSDCAVQAHAAPGTPRAPHGQRFIVPTSWKRAGNVTRPPTRTIVTAPSSSG